MGAAPKGRVRLNREQALVLSSLLAEARHRLVIRRADARDRGDDLHPWQVKIAIVSDVQEEVDRTIGEMGWTTSE
jgi:hypothetical protein